MKLKVCGMRYRENIKDIASLQPDYLGFIFHEPSVRYFDGIIPDLPSTIKRVGVFVDKDFDEICQAIDTHDLDVIQLHGNESPDLCAQLKDRKSVEIIKVFSIKNEFNFAQLNPYEEVCDFYLFDTKGELPGGNGYQFDWHILSDYPSTKPYFLSGGITADDLGKLESFKQHKAATYCHAIDVNSRFEMKAGLKNVDLLKEFKKHL